MNKFSGIITTLLIILNLHFCANNKTVQDFNILIFTKTTEYKHKSTIKAVSTIQAVCKKNNIIADSTSDARYFSEKRLEKYDAIMFLNTSGNVLNDEQKLAFQTYYRNGKGFIGIHCATCTEYDWEWYGRLVGTHFKDHPKPQKATLRVVNKSHISTRHLPDEWIRTDEWYNFRTSLLDNITVLVEIDEESYQGGSHGAHHPFSWYHEYDGGKSWYTAGGHFAEHFTDSLFANHILGGIIYAVGKE